MPDRKHCSPSEFVVSHFRDKRKDQQAEKDKAERVTGLGRKTRDTKVEPNDSPEIPDRGEMSDIPSLPSEL